VGYALIWFEALVVALLALALATAWAARGSRIRALWPALFFFTVVAIGAFLVLFTDSSQSQWENSLRTSWQTFCVSWLAAYAVFSVFLWIWGRRRLGPGLARAATAWPRANLWLGFGAALIALGLTIWNMDLAALADLAIARQEAGAVLLAMTPPPAADAENAAIVYAEFSRNATEHIDRPWEDYCLRGFAGPQPLDWRDPYAAALVKRHEAALALLRKAAAMPHCDFHYQRSLLDAVTDGGPEMRNLGRGITLLAIDARVKATEGNLQRAFDDISAILGIMRHLAQYPGVAWFHEAAGWRALEDVLRIAPADKALPALQIPELFPLVRRALEEQALLSMIFPAAASQPSLIHDDLRKHDGPLAPCVVDVVAVPARVFLIPDDVSAMRALFEAYQKSPRRAGEETPQNWAELKASTDNERMSMFGAVFIKPKHKKLAHDAAELAALRQTARTGYAAAAYRGKHGDYPQRLEQLVPEFLTSVPVDPRDGQPLRIKHLPDMIVIYAAQDQKAVDEIRLTEPSWRYLPIFRLYTPLK